MVCWLYRMVGGKYRKRKKMSPSMSAVIDNRERMKILKRLRKLSLVVFGENLRYCFSLCVVSIVVMIVVVQKLLRFVNSRAMAPAGSALLFSCAIDRIHTWCTCISKISNKVGRIDRL